MEKDDEVKRKAVGKLDVQRLRQFAQPDTSPIFPEDIQKSPKLQKKEFQKYRSLKIFKVPVQLISSDGKKRLHYNEEAIAELLKVDHNVNVVAVVGLYRTGKSFLLNRLAGDGKAFEIGHTCNAMTLGVWIMCLPHPTQESQVLVLLDTEGLGAVLEDKGMEDKWHFLIATLLSSTLVYNHKGIIDSDTIQKLSFLKEIKSAMRVLDTECEDDSYFDVFFPSFVLVNRDISLKISDQKGNPITPDEYLENVLAIKAGGTGSIRIYNTPRLLVRKYFKERKCFMISPPTNPETLNERRILRNNSFEKDIDALVEYIYTCKPKRMTSGKVLNGIMLGSLVRSYTKFIQEGKPPCIYTAVKEMVEYENQNIVQEAQSIYKKEMQNLISDALPGTEAMSRFHLQSADTAIYYLRKEIIYDDVELFMDTAMDSFRKVLDRLILSITKDSEAICWGKLSYLNSQRIERKINLKAYQHVAGYDEYLADVEWIVKQYKKTIGLGPKKMQVLQSYLDGKEQEEEIIYQLVRAAQEGGRGNELSTTNASEAESFFIKTLLLQNGWCDKAEQCANECEPKIENIKRPTFTQLTHQFETLSAHDLIDEVENDQQEKKRELTKNLHHFKDLKDKEFDRQVKENAEIAPDTEKEIKQFTEVFLESSYCTEKQLDPSKYISDSDLASASGISGEPRPLPCKIL